MTKEVKDEILKNIGLIALDLDRTLLTKNGLTDGTKECLEEAIRRGIQVVIATGRPYVALPESIRAVKGLDYVICSNGAHIADLRSGEFIYSDYIPLQASAWVRDYLMPLGFTVEVFTEGSAYIQQDRYDHYKANIGVIEGAEYTVRTRTPIPDIWQFWKEHEDKIENINILFNDPEDKKRMALELTANEGIGFTLTSSMSYNLEVGGLNTSKANALKEFSSISGIPLKRVMSFGDSPNDSAMIIESGFGVAMGNAVDEVKAIADYIAPSNEEEGVMKTIKELLFK